MPMAGYQQPVGGFQQFSQQMPGMMPMSSKGQFEDDEDEEDFSDNQSDVVEMIE